MELTWSKDKKYKKAFIAIEKKDKLNENDASVYSTFEKDMTLYLVLDKKLDGYELYEAILKKFKESKGCKYDVDLDSFLKIVDEKYHDRLLMGLVSALIYVSNIPWTMKTTEVKVPTFNIISSNLSNYEAKLNEYKIVAEAQLFTRRLQDMPSNLMYPQSFVDAIKEQFKDVKNVKITVFDTDELNKKGMKLLTGVGQGTKDPKFSPKLVQIELNNNPSSKERYAYVGKGVCFDAGGYNLKTGPHMRWMKMDMSGAAIVSGCVYALAKNNIKTNIVALCPLVLNLIGDLAQRPDDVITSYSGKTVEIDNTDAEGRLILADSITYAAKDLKVDEIYDVATLTGAMIYSLGETYTGTWATSDALWNKTLKSAKLACEQVWRLPFHHEFTEMLTKSSVADIVNSCNGPAAGSSRAACFLKEFTLGTEYVHFDVAATADKGNVGTGIILRTLYNVAKEQK